MKASPVNGVGGQRVSAVPTPSARKHVAAKTVYLLVHRGQLLLHACGQPRPVDPECRFAGPGQENHPENG